MTTRISATDVVRNFSELLNNIKYRGDRYTIMRGGKPAASLVPVEGNVKGIRLSDLRDIVSTLPHIDDSDTTFEADVMAAAKSQPYMPEPQSWE